MIEANRAIKKSATVGNYSEQYLVDCVTSSYGAYGCNGGWPASAIKYAGDHGGLPSTAAYPYTGVRGTCKTTVAKTQYQVSTWVKYISPASVNTQILSTTMSVCVLVNNGWYSYASGIYGGCPTSVSSINHAVVLVGIDAVGNYKIRNSWSKGWGMSGYMWIRGTRDCGVRQYAYIPVLA